MVKFTYFLASFDGDGVPANNNYNPSGAAGNKQLKKTIGNNLLEEINKLLPETTDLPKKRPEWIKSADIDIKSDCVIDLTFIKEGAGYTNSIGYYTYKTGKPPKTKEDVKTIYVAFPNFSAAGSGGNHVAGDTVRLASKFNHSNNGRHNIVTPTSYTFEAGTTLGFVLLVNAYREYKNDLNKDMRDGAMYFSTSELNPEEKAYNRHHTVVVKSEILANGLIFGFEDLSRNEGKGDADFNDAILLCTLSDMNAIDDKAVNYTTENYKQGTIICEDQIKGDIFEDNDYSDCIIEFYGTQTLSNGKITKMTLDYHLKHRSSLYDHEFGIVIPNLRSTHCVIERETFIGSSPESSFETIELNARNEIPIFTSTKAALPGGNHEHYANTVNGWEESPTPVSSVRCKFTFPGSGIYEENLKSIMPYNMYLKAYAKPPYVAGTGRYHYIRLDNDYPHSSTFTIEGYDEIPKMLFIQDFVEYRCPKERYNLKDIYPDFEGYINSNRLRNTNWYVNAKPQYLNNYLSIPERLWYLN